jgi:hypothetical protein
MGKITNEEFQRLWGIAVTAHNGESVSRWKILSMMYNGAKTRGVSVFDRIKIVDWCVKYGIVTQEEGYAMSEEHKDDFDKFMDEIRIRLGIDEKDKDIFQVKGN